jgi:drug/metabolite transporter (DMT)-like permease
MTSRRGTLLGLAAIVLWSAMVGLIRTVTDSFGATLGVALIYTLAAVGLWVTRRPRRLGSFPLGYLLIGGGLFVVYEVAVGLSLGLASNASQTIQVSIVNYSWPTLAMLLTVMLNRGRGASWLLVPGSCWLPRASSGSLAATQVSAQRASP